MDNLKIANPNEYNTMLQIIYFYYQNILLTMNNDNSALLNFSQLYAKLNKEASSYTPNTYLSLRNTFLSYDFQKSNNFYDSLNSFLKKYDNDPDLKVNSSLLFFLEQILIQNFQIENTNTNINTNELILFFTNYVNISKSYYNTDNSNIIET